MAKCRFHDYFGKGWIIIEKVPVVSKDDINENSRMPATVYIGGTVKKELSGKEGSKYLLFSTKKPWDIESVDCVSEFFLRNDQLIEIE